MNKRNKYRIERTAEKIRGVDPQSRILDLGFATDTKRYLQELLPKHNLETIEFDYHEMTDKWQKKAFDFVTSFEVFEHLVNPWYVLQNLPADKLIATVPIFHFWTKDLWHEDDKHRRHYHEFRERDLKMLLEESGWRLTHLERWGYEKPIGYGPRQLLSLILPRWYYFEAER